ncbi:MAG: PEP-CTERM sorting domain-containing protein [Acidobacteria bacterium]|nr:PEP-CTERM sorting domain-containing protein [Acidobacteriota bacterium]
MRKAILTLCLALPASATVLYTTTDNTFPDANWTSTIIDQGNLVSASQTSLQIVTGGVGGAGDPYRQTTHNYTPNSSGFGAIVVAHMLAGATYSPGLPVDTIDFSYALIGPSNVAYSLVIQQGVDYFVLSTFDVSNFSATWNANSHSGTTAINYCRVFTNAAYPATDCTVHPDFSQPMNLGYATANSSPQANFTLPPLTAGIDGFTVTLNSSVPEPATNALCGVALLALGAWRRLRRR